MIHLFLKTEDKWLTCRSEMGVDGRTFHEILRISEKDARHDNLSTILASLTRNTHRADSDAMKGCCALVGTNAKISVAWEFPEIE